MEKDTKKKNTTQETQEATQKAVESKDDKLQNEKTTTAAATAYEAIVAAPLVVVRRTPAQNVKPIGTLRKGTVVHVIGSAEGYAILENGTYVKADLLTKPAT